MTDDRDAKAPLTHAEILRAQREARLAAEMRANLMKRKTLKRTRAAADTASADANSPDPGPLEPEH